MAESAELVELRRLIWPVLTAHNERGVKQRAFLTEPFVDGFLFGAIAQYGKAQPQLSDRQRIRLLMTIDEMITPSWSGIFGLIQLVVSPHPRKKYESEKNPDWARGTANGAKFMRWIYRSSFPDIDQDPDVRSAISSAQIMQQASVVSRDDPNWTDKIRPPTQDEVTHELYQDLFLDVVDERFKGAGT